MKMRRDKNRANCYNAEVFTKGILRVTGKRRVDLIIRIIKYGGGEDKEFLLYQSVLKRVRSFLSQKYANFTKVKLLQKVQCQRRIKQVIIHFQMQLWVLS